MKQSQPVKQNMEDCVRRTSPYVERVNLYSQDRLAEDTDNVSAICLAKF